MNGFFYKVYEAVLRVPQGKVTTYGDIARAIGAPRMSRYVGHALHRNPRPGVIPCHRVVFRDGSLSESFAFGGKEVQRALLVAEGVEISEEDRVPLEKYRCEISLLCPAEGEDDGSAGQPGAIPPESTLRQDHKEIE